MDDFGFGQRGKNDEHEIECDIQLGKHG